MTIPSLVLALALTGPAQSDAARRAEQAFAAKDYDAAAEAAAQAYAEQGDPVFLYAQAQAERLGGNCRDAVVHYRAFVEAVPSGQAADTARNNITECEEQLAEEQPEPEPVPPPPGVAPLEDTTTPPDPVDDGLATADEPPPPAERRAIRDPWGWTLVGVGAVTMGVGTGLYARARLDARDARNADDVFSYGEAIDRAYLLSRVGPPVIAVGGALVIGGVIRFAVLARRGQRPSERVGLGPGGLALCW